MNHFIPSFTFIGFFVGPLYIYSWGLFVVIGILFATWMAEKKRQKMKKARNSFGIGFSKDQFLNLCFNLIIAILVGARISFIIETWSYYEKHLNSIFKIWEGGFSFFGGVIGAFLYGFYWCKKNKIDFILLGSIFTPAWLFGLFFGRIGCFLIHDHLGRPTRSFLGIFFKGAYRHEPALYEAIWVFLLAIGFLMWEKKYKLKRALKYIFPLSLVLYSFGRFWIDFFRADSVEGGDDRFLLLTFAQWISMGIILWGVWMIKKEKTIFNISKD